MKFFLLILAVISMQPAFSSSHEMCLDEGWSFRSARGTRWYDASVPGVIHTDLIDNKLIEDPFYRLNERGLQWIDKEDWIYQRGFDVDAQTLARTNAELLFDGLDTYADVYLNDSLILSADNMFRRWTVDIKPLLRAKDNVLKVYFHSPVKVDVPKWDALPFQYRANNDQSENGGLMQKKIGIFARKAGYHYGWDWGPRLVTCGIWRPVRLRTWDDARLEDLFFRQDRVTDKRAEVVVEVQITADKTLPGACVAVRDGASGRIMGQRTCDLVPGQNTLEVAFTQNNPQLWWCNGLGKAHLYNYQTTLTLDGQVADSCNTAVGLRSLRLVTDTDAAGKTFYFELNGVPVFAKGANYIPCDSFLPRVSPAVYEKTVDDAVAANMNMLRVWGGGTYEQDLFYELCDRKGILVWQDFMFACSLYPAEGAFLENVRKEAEDNIQRLRNHASIALWCGNNECNEAWYTWGWKEEYEAQNPEYARLIWDQQKALYFDVLAQAVAKYAPGVAYRPSSPFASYDGPSAENTGDRHYWDVWHARKPICCYNTTRSRFFSEYGFQSFPEFESVKRYAPQPRDWAVDSEVMMAHQRGGDFANSLIESYMHSEYGKPKDFPSFLYVNQVMQGDAIRTAIEAHRRDMPYCMGTLFWQHNDCWPVASWSSRDYYGRWKAQHYFTRKAFREILVSPITKEDRLEVWLVSDRQQPVRGLLTVCVMDLWGKPLFTKTASLVLPANTAIEAFQTPLVAALRGRPASEVVVTASFRTSQGALYDNIYLPCLSKEMAYPQPTITSRIVGRTTQGVEVEVVSNLFARGVYLGLGDAVSVFSDNYFDLLPNVPVRVTLTTTLAEQEIVERLHIRSMADAY